MIKPSHNISWADYIGHYHEHDLAADLRDRKRLCMEMAVLDVDKVRIHYRVDACGLTLYDGPDLGKAMEHYNHA